MMTTRTFSAATGGGFIRLAGCCFVLLIGVSELRGQDAAKTVPAEAGPAKTGAVEREPAATRPGPRSAVRPGARPAARPAGSGQVSDAEVVDAARAAADKAARVTARARGEITFDDLKFDIEPDAPYDASMLTDDIREFDGKVVKLRGYILPSTLFRETNIDEFVLVRDNLECCFGPGAALYDCVVVNLVDGVRTDFTTRPVTVTGKFQLKEYKYPDGSGHFAIFNLLGTAVK